MLQRSPQQQHFCCQTNILWPAPTRTCHYTTHGTVCIAACACGVEHTDMRDCRTVSSGMTMSSCSTCLHPLIRRRNRQLERHSQHSKPICSNVSKARFIIEQCWQKQYSKKKHKNENKKSVYPILLFRPLDHTYALLAGSCSATYLQQTGF